MSNNESISEARSGETVVDSLRIGLLKWSWIFWCAAMIAPALTVDSIPFGGMSGIFAAGGRYPLRIAALGMPLAISALLWAVAFVRQPRIRYSPFLWGLLGLLGVAGLSTMFAIDSRVALFGFWIDEQGMLVWLMYFLLTFLGSQLISSKARLFQLAYCVVALGAVVAGIAVLEVSGVRFFGILAQEWVYQRGVSTMMNPDFLGGFLVAPFVLAVALASARHGVVRWISAAAAVVMFLSLGYTLTRGAWVGALAGLVALGVLRFVGRRTAEDTHEGNPADRTGGLPRWAVWVGVIVATILGFVMLGVDAIVTRFSQSMERLSDLDALLSSRLSIWSEVVAAIQAHPLLGAGPDNTVYAWQPFAGEATLRTVGSGALVNSAHNVVLDLAVQFGVPFALVAAAGSVWLVVRVSVKSIASERPDDSTLLQRGIVASFAGMLVGLLTGVTSVPTMALLTALVAALIALDASRFSALPSGSRYPVAVGTVALAVGLMWFSFSMGASAFAGNQYTQTAVERAQRDLAALKYAPWRIYPASDLVSVVQTLGEAEQGMISMPMDRALQMLYDRDGKNAITIYQMGDYFLLQRRDAETALEYAQRSLVERPVFVAGLMLKGDALMALGRSDEALPFLEEAVRLESEAPPLLAWEAPWVSYAKALVALADGDPAAVQAAEELLSSYSERFPTSLELPGIRDQLSGPAGGTPQP